jgi:hypothetical protein
MQNNKITNEPKRLTRATLFAQQLRIAHVYGASPIGTRLQILYARRVGASSFVFDVDHQGDLSAERFGFDRGDEREILDRVADEFFGVRCSRNYYRRRRLTHWQRLDRERAARIERGERHGWLLDRQAA